MQKCIPAIVFIICFVWCKSPVQADESQQPNIVVILADDAGWGDFSCVGNKTISTPAVDSLARDGALLEQFFVQPVCAPTRAEFLTGRYHDRSGVRGVTRGEERMSPEEETVADVFKKVGYVTGCFGKWHNGTQWPYHPLARGFDTFYGFTEGHWGDYFNPPMQHNTVFEEGEGYITDDITTKAISFFSNNVKSSAAKPVLCYVAFNTPHSPMCIPDADWSRFAERPLLQRGPEVNKENPVFTRAALAMVENLDKNVGRILAAIDAAGVSRETIVVFFSDNGPNSQRWCGGMRGKKGSTDDGGTRSICCIRYPGQIASGVRLPQITGAIDLLPTLAGLTGVQLNSPKPLDGIDLTAMLKEDTAEQSKSKELGLELGRRHMVASQRGRISIRTQRFRLDDKGRLYDMLTDIGQKRDISKEQSEERERLKTIADDWKKDILDRMPQPDVERFPVGYAGAPLTELPARDGYGEGGVVHSGRAPNCSFFTGWKDTEDSLVWDVDVLNTDTYTAKIWYTCPAEDVGSTIQLSCGENRITTSVTTPWDPPLNTGEDRVDRGSESYVKPFHVLSLGDIKLEAGETQLRLTALHVQGESVADVRRIVLYPAAN
ncbi:MAG: sulfatase-like hydrolase/transferase [Pirellulales bacterium]